MADPKKPEPIPPEQQTYPTPPLDPATGAPLDTRFQSDNSQEVVPQEPPKSETPSQAENGDDEDDGDDEEGHKQKGSKKRR